VSASPKGPIDYPIAELAPDRFEALTFLLARADDPAVVPVRNKDFGLDARLPGPQGRRTLRGWQAKRFTDAIPWAKCRESVDRALAFWRPPRITFCFAHDLSAKEQDQFRTELADRFPEVRLDFWVRLSYSDGCVTPMRVAEQRRGCSRTPRSAWRRCSAHTPSAAPWRTAGRPASGRP